MIAIDRILCPLDFSDGSRHALEYAVAMARFYGARVTALHVFADVPVVTSAPFGLEAVQAVGLRNVDREAITDASKRFVAQVPATDVALDVRVAENMDTCGEILAQADAVNADVIVMGSHGRSGFQRILLGSIAGKVLRRSRRPVMIVPPHAECHAPLAMPFRRLLCPIDFSDGSLRALEAAVSLAEEADGLLTLLHVIELPPELDEVPLAHDADMETLRAAATANCRHRLDALVPADVRTYCTVETRVVEGRVHQKIIHEAGGQNADLIVMGVRGRSAVDVTVFGSNTESVIRRAACPVLTVRE